MPCKDSPGITQNAEHEAHEKDWRRTVKTFIMHILFYIDFTEAV